jgi:hypothetical protein
VPFNRGVIRQETMFKKSSAFWESRKRKLAKDLKRNFVFAVIGIVLSFATWFYNPFVFLFLVSLTGIPLFNLCFGYVLYLESDHQVNVNNDV